MSRRVHGPAVLLLVLMFSGREVAAQALPLHEFTWSQGNASSYMGASGSQFCALTRMTGHFQGEGEYIHASTVAKGAWFLGGGSLQAGVAASARCSYVSDSQYSDEYTWNETMAGPTYMGHSSGRACVLTFISGNFDGADAWVRAYVVAGSWWLEGSTAGKQLEVRARCVGNLPAMTVEYSWNQYESLPTLMGTIYGYACGFTFVQGNFKGGGESVRIYPAGASWYLGGTSQQNDVAAKAQCFSVPWMLSAGAGLPQGG